MALEITYCMGARNENLTGNPIDSETRTISATSAQSGATPSNAVYVKLKATANLRFAYGSNPTATATAGASGHYLGSGDVFYLDAVSGHKLAAITAA